MDDNITVTLSKAEDDKVRVDIWSPAFADAQTSDNVEDAMAWASQRLGNSPDPFQPYED